MASGVGVGGETTTDPEEVIKFTGLNLNHSKKWAVNNKWNANKVKYENGELLLEKFLELILTLKSYDPKSKGSWDKVRFELNLLLETETENCRVSATSETMKKWNDHLITVVFGIDREELSKCHKWLEYKVTWLGFVSYNYDITIGTDSEPPLPQWKQTVINIERQRLLVKTPPSVKSCFPTIKTDTWRLLTDFFAAAVGAVVVAIQISQPGPYNEYSNYIISFALLLAYVSRWVQYHDGNYPLFITTFKHARLYNMFTFKKEFKQSIWLTFIAYAVTIAVNNIAIANPDYDNATTIAISVTTFLVAFEGDFSNVVKLVGEPSKTAPVGVSEASDKAKQVEEETARSVPGGNMAAVPGEGVEPGASYRCSPCYPSTSCITLSDKV